MDTFPLKNYTMKSIYFIGFLCAAAEAANPSSPTRQPVQELFIRRDKSFLVTNEYPIQHPSMKSAPYTLFSKCTDTLDDPIQIPQTMFTLEEPIPSEACDNFGGIQYTYRINQLCRAPQSLFPLFQLQVLFSLLMTAEDLRRKSLHFNISQAFICPYFDDKNHIQVAIHHNVPYTHGILHDDKLLSLENYYFPDRLENVPTMRVESFSYYPQLVSFLRPEIPVNAFTPCELYQIFGFTELTKKTKEEALNQLSALRHAALFFSPLPDHTVEEDSFRWRAFDSLEANDQPNYQKDQLYPTSNRSSLPENITASCPLALQDLLENLHASVKKNNVNSSVALIERYKSQQETKHLYHIEKDNSDTTVESRLDYKENRYGRPSCYLFGKMFYPRLIFSENLLNAMEHTHPSSTKLFLYLISSRNNVYIDRTTKALIDGGAQSIGQAIDAIVQYPLHLVGRFLRKGKNLFTPKQLEEKKREEEEKLKKEELKAREIEEEKEKSKEWKQKRSEVASTIRDLCKLYLSEVMKRAVDKDIDSITIPVRRSLIFIESLCTPMKEENHSTGYLYPLLSLIHRTGLFKRDSSPVAQLLRPSAHPSGTLLLLRSALYQIFNVETEMTNVPQWIFPFNQSILSPTFPLSHLGARPDEEEFSSEEAPLPQPDHSEESVSFKADEESIPSESSSSEEVTSPITFDETLFGKLPPNWSTVTNEGAFNVEDKPDCENEVCDRIVDEESVFIPSPSDFIITEESVIPSLKKKEKPLKVEEDMKTLLETDVHHASQFSDTEVMNAVNENSEESSDIGSTPPYNETEISSPSEDKEISAIWGEKRVSEVVQDEALSQEESASPTSLPKEKTYEPVFYTGKMPEGDFNFSLSTKPVPKKRTELLSTNLRGGESGKKQSKNEFMCSWLLGEGISHFFNSLNQLLHYHFMAEKKFHVTTFEMRFLRLSSAMKSSLEELKKYERVFQIAQNNPMDKTLHPHKQIPNDYSIRVVKEREHEQEDNLEENYSDATGVPHALNVYLQLLDAVIEKEVDPSLVTPIFNVEIDMAQYDHVSKGRMDTVERILAAIKRYDEWLRTFVQERNYKDRVLRKTEEEKENALNLIYKYHEISNSITHVEDQIMLLLPFEQKPLFSNVVKRDRQEVSDRSVMVILQCYLLYSEEAASVVESNETGLKRERVWEEREGLRRMSPERLRRRCVEEEEYWGLSFSEAHEGHRFYFLVTEALRWRNEREKMLLKSQISLPEQFLLFLYPRIKTLADTALHFY